MLPDSEGIYTRITENYDGCSPTIPFPRLICTLLSSLPLTIPTSLSQHTLNTFTPSPAAIFPRPFALSLSMQYKLCPTFPSFPLLLDLTSQTRHVPSWLPLTSPYEFGGSTAKLTTALEWPRSVIADTVVAEARGSMSVMCRDTEPAASKLRDGSAVKEKRAAPVDRVSTHLEVGRSQVLTV